MTAQEVPFGVVGATTRSLVRHPRSPPPADSARSSFTHVNRLDHDLTVLKTHYTDAQKSDAFDLKDEQGVVGGRSDGSQP